MPYAATPNRGFSSIDHALFQARMWREYALAFDNLGTPRQTYERRWLESVLRMTKAECLERARKAVEAAREINARQLAGKGGE